MKYRLPWLVLAAAGEEGSVISPWLSAPLLIFLLARAVVGPLVVAAGGIHVRMPGKSGPPGNVPVLLTVELPANLIDLTGTAEHRVSFCPGGGPGGNYRRLLLSFKILINRYAIVLLSP